MKPITLLPFVAALALTSPVHAQDADCVTGDVTFATQGVAHTLDLFIHETKYEVPKGLYKLTELPKYGGVLALYDGPRDGRTLNNSDVLVADMMSFDANGKAISLMVDDTGTKVDKFQAGNGMRFALYVDGGTVADKGFTADTTIIGLTCTKYK